MRIRDQLAFALRSVRAATLRSALTALGLAIGIFAVVLLTALGTGLERALVHEFTRFGTNHVVVQPGLTQTHGVAGGMVHNVRPLTLADNAALERLPGVLTTSPQVSGNAEAKFGQRTRRVTVLGSGPDAAAMFHMAVATGSFLPDDPPEQARALAVLGARVARELFGAQSPLGQRVTLAQRRFTVVGALAPCGDILGFDLDDMVYVPTVPAMALFNRSDLQEIHVAFDPARASAAQAVAQIDAALRARHGRVDYTIVEQAAMLSAIGSVLAMLTAAVGALGGISLLVGAVGITTITTIAVTERTHEIGLLVALGATRRQVRNTFLLEALLTAFAGGGAGLGLGWLSVALVRHVVPALPAAVSMGSALLAFALAATIGLAAAVWPALRAARLDPIEALRAE